MTPIYVGERPKCYHAVSLDKNFKKLEMFACFSCPSEIINEAYKNRKCAFVFFGDIKWTIQNG